MKHVDISCRYNVTSQTAHFPAPADFEVHMDTKPSDFGVDHRTLMPINGLCIDYRTLTPINELCTNYRTLTPINELLHRPSNFNAD